MTPESIQVIRVGPLAAALWGEPIPNDVSALSALIERISDVIELTEEVTLDRPGDQRRRLVSEWEPVDA